MQHGNKPFPPFGTLLYQLQALDIKIEFSPYIFCGSDARTEAFRMNSKGQIALYLPQNKYIQDYQWPIDNLSIILFNTGSIEPHLLNLYALSLLDEGAKQVTIYHGDLSAIEIYHK